MAKKAEKEAPETEAQSDGPILDMTNAEVKKLLKTAKARGYVTYDELNSILPSAEFSSQQIEDVMAQLSELGINVVEHEEEDEEAAGAGDDDADEEGPSRALAKSSEKGVATGNAAAGSDRTDDPVRMYLREMGSVELLSREGEIEISTDRDGWKRIRALSGSERGREA